MAMDGYGGMHPFGTAPAIGNGPYWANYDIARGAVMWSGAGTSPPGGWVLDGLGGVHAVGSAPQVATGAYWPGFDIGRGLTAAGEGSSSRKH